MFVFYLLGLAEIEIYAVLSYENFAAYLFRPYFTMPMIVLIPKQCPIPSSYDGVVLFVEKVLAVQSCICYAAGDPWY